LTTIGEKLYRTLRDSLFAIRRSLFAIRYSLFAIRFSAIGTLGTLGTNPLAP
jgi:hypothetical protein